MTNKIKCSTCAYACSREEGKYHVCRYPNDETQEHFVSPVGDWVPNWCPKIDAIEDQKRGPVI